MAGEKRLSFKSLGWLTTINVVVAIVGVVQTVVIAAVFGVSRTIEIFFAATTFLAFLQQLAASGQLGDLFTPIFHDLQVSSGKQSARDAFSAMTNVMFLLSSVIALAAALLSDQFARLLVPGFSQEDIALCGDVFFATAPLIMLQVVNGMYSNFLRAEHYYGVEETLGLVSKIANLIVLLTLGWTLGIWALIIGLWVAAIIALTGQIIFTFRKGYRFRLGFSTAEFNPRTVLMKVPYTFLHTGASQFFVFAQTSAFSFLPPGPYATYSYAARLQAKFQGIILRPIGLLFFNKFSQALAEGALRVRSYADHALSLSVALVSVFAVPIACAGDLLLMGLWGGKQFPLEDIKDAHLVLVVLTYLLLGIAQYLVSRRTNLAMKVVARQFAASGVVMLLAGLACYWLIPLYGIWGALWVQLLSTVGTCISTLIVLWCVDKEMVSIIPIRKWLAWLIASAIAIGITLALRKSLGPSLDAERWLVLTAAVAYGLISVSICLVASWLMRIEESTEIMSKIVTTFHKRKLASSAPTSATNG